VAINLNSQIVGIERSTKNIVIGCMDKGLYCYTTKGKKLWRLEMPGDILTLGSMEIKTKGIQAVIVALSNNEVHIYKDKFIISKFITQDIVVGIKFGKFGREDSNLIMSTKSKNNKLISYLIRILLLRHTIL
jgi:Bardet-Biedl syndrome 1 protein